VLFNESRQPLIVTHSCYITFLTTTFTSSYLSYIIDSKKIDDDIPSLEIYCTKTYDLKTPNGRKNAAEDLLTLCKKGLAEREKKDEDLEEEEEEERKMKMKMKRKRMEDGG